jgi:phage repressor protein C with HTH and peptisase S24 domain
VVVSENARKLKELRERAGLGLREVARLLGWGHTRYQHYEDFFKSKYLPVEIVELIGPHFVGRGEPPITEAEMYALAGAAPPSPVTQIRPPPPNGQIAIDAQPTLVQRMDMPRDLPVLGSAAGGEMGDFVTNGEVVDMIRRPPSLAHRKDVFACYVDGTSMVPWRQPREPVVVDRTRKPQIGDHVVVEMKPTSPDDMRSAYVKKLLKITGSKVRLGQYNPALEFELPLAKVLHIYRAMEWHEILLV